MADLPRELRPSVVAISAPPPSASISDKVAASSPTLAAHSTASQAPYAAPQVATPCVSAPTNQAFLSRESRLSAATSAPAPSATATSAPAPSPPAFSSPAPSTPSTSEPATSESAASASTSSALAPLASTSDSVAASLPALASPIAALKAPCVPPQIAASSFSAQSPQTLPDATHLTPLLHLSEAPGGEAPSSGAPSTGSKVSVGRFPDRPHSDSVDDSDKKRRVNEIKLRQNNNRQRVRFKILIRPRCALYRNYLEFGTQWQPRSVDRHLQRRRGRLKVNSQLLATLPEALCDELDCEQLEEVEEVSTPSDEPEVSQLHQPRSLDCISHSPSEEAEVPQ